MAGYQEIEHTADWALEVWAPDFASLLEQAARGMMALMRIRLKAGPPQRRSFSLQGGDREEVLVNFLSELLFLLETEGVAFESIVVTEDRGTVAVIATLVPVAHQDKEIKAVTYHNLKIRRSKAGLRVNLVFDV